MKVAQVVLAILVLSTTTCGGTSPVTERCDGTTCTRGSSSERIAFDGFTPVSHRDAPPISLTAPDGTAMRLEKLDGDTVVDGPLAYTELRITFVNPEPRLIEGRFRIVLPPGASVSRFAMKIAGRWQEGEVVEQRRATEVYEDFLHQKVDPALLEAGAANELTARVYPIVAKGSVELVVGYSQELDGRIEELVPAGAPIERTQVRLRDASSPGRAFELADAPDALFHGESGLRSGPFVVARVAPAIDVPPEPLRGMVVLLDTSASRAFDLDDSLAILSALVRRIAARAPDAPVVLGCFDQRVERIFAGPASELGPAHARRIASRRALGASALDHALLWAGRQARAHGITRVLAITDGVPTAGSTDASALAETVRALGDRGVERLDAVTMGGIVDQALLRTLASAGLPRAGVVVDGALAGETLWRKLNSGTRAELEVEVDGARFWWPRRLSGVQPGDEMLLYAELEDSAELRVRVGGASQALPRLRESERPLVERAVARARIASLVDREHREGRSEALRKEIVELSTRHRVLSPYTSLLVLEQDWHYRRFGIDRQALSDVLTVRDGRLDVLKRSAPSAPADGIGDGPTPLDARGAMWGDAIGDSFGAGGLGLSRIGERGGGRAGSGSIGHDASSTTSGFGSGHGRLGRSHRARAPRLRMGRVVVTGRLPPEVIQRIVRLNFGRFRGAYQGALQRKPGVRGRVVIRFVIDRKGAVSNAQIASSDIADERFAAELLKAFEALSFPKPEGGVITVMYPLSFSPEGDAPAPAAMRPNRTPRPQPANEPPRDVEPAAPSPYQGELAEVMRALREKQVARALDRAARWHARAPGDVLALVALGEALEAAGQPSWAARAYGSIVDLFPTRADLRRFAAGYLERAGALALATDSYGKARTDRPDHPSSHRHYAFALLKQRRHREAFEVLVAAASRRYADGRFHGVDEVLREDLGIVAAAWLAAEPGRRDDIERGLARVGARLAKAPSLRFVLTWETDANDVDLHVYADGGHAFYGNELLPSGGRFHADVTNGFGPELFAVRGERAAGTRYRLQAHYYARGPMGYGMGKLQVLEHDGRGGLRFDERPFVVMSDGAYVDLGEAG